MKKGFSLIELMTVMAIFVILLVASIIYLAGFRFQYSLLTTSRSISYYLRDAYQRSATQEDGYYWGVFFRNSGPNQSHFLLFNATDTIPSTMATSSIKYLSGGVDFLDPQAGLNTTIIFDKITGSLVKSGCPSPTVSTTVQIVVVTNTSTPKTIKVYCNGRIESS